MPEKAIEWSDNMPAKAIELYQLRLGIYFSNKVGIHIGIPVRQRQYGKQHHMQKQVAEKQHAWSKVKAAHLVEHQIHITCGS